MPPGKPPNGMVKAFVGLLPILVLLLGAVYHFGYAQAKLSEQSERMVGYEEEQGELMSQIQQDHRDVMKEIAKLRESLAGLEGRVSHLVTLAEKKQGD